MSETENFKMCIVHGPGHAGQPCPDQRTEAVVDPTEEYGSIGNLFSMENLSDNFDEVKDQLDQIKELISKYSDLREKHKTDLDMDQYADEYDEKIRSALVNFTINKKKIDISKLSKSVGFREIYNDIIYEINDYVELFMIGKNISRLSEL